jgi:hypothetical protein
VKQFPPEVRQEAVQLYRVSGRSFRPVANELHAGRAGVAAPQARRAAGRAPGPCDAAHTVVFVGDGTGLVCRYLLKNSFQNQRVEGHAREAHHVALC